MLRKSGKCRAGKLDFAINFIKPSILHKIKTNIGKIDYNQSYVWKTKTFMKRITSWPLNNTFNAVFTFVNVFLDTLQMIECAPKLWMIACQDIFTLMSTTHVISRIYVICKYLGKWSIEETSINKALWPLPLEIVVTYFDNLQISRFISNAL